MIFDVYISMYSICCALAPGSLTSIIWRRHSLHAIQPAPIQFVKIEWIIQRKFRSSNFRLFWKLPPGLAASMLDSRDVLQRRCETWEILAGRNCAKCCVFSIVSWLRRLAKAGPKNGSCEGSAAQDVNKICTTSARESDLVVKIAKNWRCRGTFWSWAWQNLHHACARERFGSQNR